MRIAVAAGGGVAAIKTPFVLRRLRDAGHEVEAIASDDALRFTTELALAVASGGEVLTRAAWFRPDGRARHLEVARRCDLLLVAPATADALAAAATGRADDVVSAVALAGVPRVAWAPAMNPAMWEHPAVRANVATLRGFGHRILGPAVGPLASAGEGSGAGRMLEPEEIVAALARAPRPRDLEGLRVLVTAGPTREWLDPVRFLSNPSSGKMGFAVAEAARERGARVELVAGPTAAPPPDGVELARVESAEEMRDAVHARAGSADVLVMTAAVADWRPRVRAAQKEPKEGPEGGAGADGARALELVRTPDVLATLPPAGPGQVRIGFAMETDAGVERAAAKAARKALDLICLNWPTREGSAFGGDLNEVVLVRPDGASEPLPRMPKRDLGDAILDRALALRSARGGAPG